MLTLFPKLMVILLSSSCSTPFLCPRCPGPLDPSIHLFTNASHQPLTSCVYFCSVTTLMLWKKILWDVLSVICSVWDSNLQAAGTSLFSIVSRILRCETAELNLSFKDSGLWQLEKCPASTPTWSFFLFCFSWCSEEDHFCFIFSSFWWDTRDCIRSGFFSFCWPTHTRYFNYNAAIWALKKEEKGSVVAALQ